KAFNQQIPGYNIERLKIWCSVGTDVKNGLWAIYGARLACYLLTDSNWNYQQIHDYEWFRNYWESEIAPRFEGFQNYCSVSQYTWNELKLSDSCLKLGSELKKSLDLDLALLSPKDSQFFKSVYVNRS